MNFGSLRQLGPYEMLSETREGFAFSTAGFSPDGRCLMSQNRIGALQLWSAPSWEEIAAAEAKDKEESRKP